MKKTYLQQLNTIAKRAKQHAAWQTASAIITKPITGVTRHVGRAY